MARHHCAYCPFDPDDRIVSLFEIGTALSADHVTPTDWLHGIRTTAECPPSS